MFEIRPITQTTQREETAHQETQEEAKASTLDLVLAYIIHTIGGIFFR